VPTALAQESTSVTLEMAKKIEAFHSSARTRGSRMTT
jgi:hypothetical protein